MVLLYYGQQKLDLKLIFMLRGVTYFFISIKVLQKNLGFFFSILVAALLVWLRSSLWLQFRPHQIAGGAAYLAAKFLNMNLASSDDVWLEFHTTPSVLKDVAHQLMELL